MPINASITATGITETIKNLSMIAEKVGNHTEFLEDVCVSELRDLFQHCFRGGHREWQPLDRATILQKLKEGFPTTPLVRTGYYRNSSVRLRGMSIRRNKLELRSPVQYAGYQEYGTRHIPRRPVFGIVTEQLQRRIVRLYRIYAQRRLLR